MLLGVATLLEQHRPLAHGKDELVLAEGLAGKAREDAVGQLVLALEGERGAGVGVDEGGETLRGSSKGG